MRRLGSFEREPGDPVGSRGYFQVPVVYAIDAGTAQPVAKLCGNEHRAIVFTAPVDANPHVLTLTVTGGTFGFDGIVVSTAYTTK